MKTSDLSNNVTDLAKRAVQGIEDLFATKKSAKKAVKTPWPKKIGDAANAAAQKIVRVEKAVAKKVSRATKQGVREVGVKSGAKTPAATKATSKKPGSKKAPAKNPAAKKAIPKKPAAKKATSKKPAAKRAAPSKPAAKKPKA